MRPDEADVVVDQSYNISKDIVSTWYRMGMLSQLKLILMYTTRLLFLCGLETEMSHLSPLAALYTHIVTDACVVHNSV